MKTKVKCATLFIIIFLCNTLCWAGEKIETQIGTFNLAKSPLTESQLVSQLGQGYVKEQKVDKKALDKKLIYYVDAEKVWVEFQLSHVLNENSERVLETILVTKNKLCDKKYKPQKSVDKLVTSKGIKLGDTIDKVIKTYGTPTVKIDITNDKLFSVLSGSLSMKKGYIFRYLTDKKDELIFAEFYFYEGRLHSLLISTSE